MCACGRVYMRESVSRNIDVLGQCFFLEHVSPCLSHYQGSSDTRSFRAWRPSLIVSFSCGVLPLKQDPCLYWLIHVFLGSLPFPSGHFFKSRRPVGPLFRFPPSLPQLNHRPPHPHPRLVLSPPLHSLLHYASPRSSSSVSGLL